MAPESTMTIWNFFTLVGGLAVFLYGMILMNRHLTAAAGEKMKSLMLTLTKGKIRGYFTGLGVTILNQSSSATTVLEAALISAGLLTFQQSLAVTLGAELGSSILPHLVAFPSISKLAPLIIAISFFISLVVKKKRSKDIVMTILGFGILFMGMDMMSVSLKPLRTFQPFLDFMIKIENPLLGIFVGLIFTMIIQSSGATAGLTIAMAMSGTISLAQAVPINLGAAVGTCITAILGSLPLNREAKRSAYIHTLFQSIGCTIAYILLLIPFQGDKFYLFIVKGFTHYVLHTDSLARQIAMAFTFMPLINLLFVIPMLKVIVAVFNKVFPPSPEQEVFGPKYINESLINNTDIALEMAEKEINRVGQIVHEMFDASKEAFLKKDMSKVQLIYDKEDKVDILRDQIIPYLTKIAAQELNETESKKEVFLLYAISEFESIGDIIDKNIGALAEKLIEKNLDFSSEGKEEIQEIHDKISKNLQMIITAFTDNNKKLANEIKNKDTDLNEKLFKDRHIKRLNIGLKKTIETSAIHMDLISYFNRINSRIIYLADMLLESM